MLAKMETFYDLDLASNVKLTIENIQYEGSSKKSDYVREAFAPTNTSIAVSHELRKSSQYFVVSDVSKEHGFGVHLHKKLILVQLPYTGEAYNVTSSYSETGGMTNVKTLITDSFYFVFFSSLLATDDIVSIPMENVKIVCSKKYGISPGCRISYSGINYVVSDVDVFSQGCNGVLMSEETRVIS